jgi:hypothetical protein
MPNPENKPVTGENQIPVTLAVIVVSGAVLVLLVLLIANIGHSGSLYSLFTHEHVDMLNMYDSRNQSFAYRISLVTTLILTLAMMVFYAQIKKLFFGKFVDLLFKYAGITFALVTFVNVLVQKQFRLALIMSGSFIFIIFYIKFWSDFFARFKKTFFTLLAVFCVLIVTAGIFFKPYTNDPQLLSESNYHYGVVMSPADRLSLGMQIGKEVNFRYGMIFPSLFSLIEKKTGLLNMGAHIKFIQYLQLIFFVLVIISVHLWKPKNYVFFIIGLLLMAPWLSTFGKACFIPNQSAFRSLGFPAGFLILLLIKDGKIIMNAAILGFCSVYLFLLNPETGITISAAYIVFMSFKTTYPVIKNIVFSIIAYAAGCAAAIVSFYIIYSMIFGFMSPGSFTGLFFYYISKFSGGYAGLKLRYEAFAVVLFVHSLFVMAHGAISRTQRNLDSNETFRMAVASSILIWLAYYVNRPDPWNLWTFVYLYIFLIPEFKGMVEKEVGIIRILNNKQVVLAACVLFPLMIAKGGREGMDIMGKINRVIYGDNKIVSGVLLPKNMAYDVTEKMDYVKAHKPGDNRYFVFSKYGYMISLETEIFNKAPFNDILTESVTENEFSDNINIIRNKKMEKIFFDRYPDETTGTDVYRKHFFERLKSKISDMYKLNEVRSGMEEWVLM